jgi:hypothetical protein
VVDLDDSTHPTLEKLVSRATAATCPRILRDRAVSWPRFL